MKTLFISLYICIAFTSITKSQNLPSTLYLIFDKNTPSVAKDVNKYMGRYAAPLIDNCYVYKIEPERYYMFKYPLLGGYPLRVKIKSGTFPQFITPLSAVSTQYPTAMTVSQLDQALQPLIEADYQRSARPSIWQNLSFQYLTNLAKTGKFYVIELEPENNRAVLMQVEITTTIH